MADILNIHDEGYDRYLKALAEIENIYPTITEKRLSLSVANVTGRIYYHWRKLGLIGEIPIEGESKQWVKLNIYEFVWLQIIKSLREFGIPLETIRELRGTLDTNFLEEIKDELDEYANFLREQTQMTENRIAQEIKNLKFAIDSAKDLPAEEKYLINILGTLVHGILLTGINASIVLYKSETGFQYGTYTFESIDDFSSIYSKWFKVPHLIIPLNNIIEEFMENPKNEKQLELWGFINKNEKKVLEAIRNQDFDEIIISKDKINDEPIVEVIKIGNITDYKASEIRKLLGLNQYDEITIKYRNNKDLYFKNKKRI